MARYDFRCRSCGSTFEVERPMALASEPAACPDGHTDTVKLIGPVAVGGRAAPECAAVRSAPAPAWCCGGACSGG